MAKLVPARKGRGFKAKARAFGEGITENVSMMRSGYLDCANSRV